MILALDDGRYRCFGCRAGGDVVQWVRDRYRLGVAHSVKLLDTRAALAAPSAFSVTGERLTAVALGRGEPPDPILSQPERMLATLRGAWGNYSYVSALEAQLGQPGRQMHPYKAPDRLVTNMRRRGFSDDGLVDAGLATRVPARVAGATTTVLDFYRHRYLVPVRDDRRQVIGLIGRYDDDHQAAKDAIYKNPPRSIVYDKTLALYRPSVDPLDPDGQIVVVDGSLDALAIAAVAQAALPAKYAVVRESGTANSPEQLHKVMAIGGRAHVLTSDGDPTGQGANTKCSTALALCGREPAVDSCEQGEDPASWLQKLGIARLTPLSRKSCLQGPPDELRPRHRAVQRAVTNGDPEDFWQAALAPAQHMPDKRADRCATAFVETVAPIVVTFATRTSTDHRGRVNDAILTVATYGRWLPGPAQVPLHGTRSLEIERADLGPAGWAQLRIQPLVAGLPARTRPIPARRWGCRTVRARALLPPTPRAACKLRWATRCGQASLHCRAWAQTHSGWCGG
jgi:hypothetical protein